MKLKNWLSICEKLSTCEDKMKSSAGDALKTATPVPKTLMAIGRCCRSHCLRLVLWFKPKKSLNSPTIGDGDLAGVKAFAPATVANLNPRFDFLGCAVDGLVDLYPHCQLHRPAQPDCHGC
uniref:Uncharacterized protein n=1 Tax=Fagus sylvatica TaxID=28930 RepID=A0A2N9HA30_FAGSY